MILRCIVFMLLFTSCPAAWGGWVVVCEDGFCESNGIPEDLSAKLHELAERRVKIRSIAFTPARGWVVFFDNKSGYAAARIPASASEKLKELAAAGADFRAIAFTPWFDNCGWILLYDQNRLVSADFPSHWRERLDGLARRDTLKSIAILRTGSFAALYGRNGSLVDEPKPKQALQTLAAKNAELVSIAFTDWNGWAVLSDAGLACDNLPDGVEADVRKLIDERHSPKCIAFCADSIRLSQDDPATRAKVLRLMSHYHVPGVSVALVENGEIAWTRTYGVVTPGGKPITPVTRFQAASISKPVTAVGALRLVEQGKLSLDDDLNRFLIGWKIPPNRFTQQTPVTLRRVLSHSAGFTVHGFPGYARGKRLPLLIDILNGQSPANTSPIILERPPGQEFSYSGGGYCVLQQAVIDVTGKPFDVVMAEQVLEPLRMSHSSYAQPPPAGFERLAAVGHGNSGRPMPDGWRNYPEMSAAGLWTTPSDLARFILGIQRAARHDSGAILRPATIDALLTKQITTQFPGIARGLGVAPEGEGDSLIFSHDGQNAGFDSLLIGYAHTGQGAVIMLNANETGGLLSELARDLGDEYHWPAAAAR